MFDTAYVSKRLEVRPAEAAGIADLWHRRLGRAPVGPRFVRAADNLWLSSTLTPVKPDPSGLRRAQGILWVRGRPVRIELELVVWSETETDLAIRPRAMGSIVGTRRYATAVCRALGAVADDLAQTKAAAAAETASYRFVRDILADRTFERPARAARGAVAFVPSPGLRREPATVGAESR